ncbi:MAG: hypothetical protein ACO3K8_11330, partial [Pseudohongiellaceae bacterium]
VDQILLERFHGLVDFLSRLSTGTERYWLACGAARLALQSRRRLRLLTGFNQVLRLSQQIIRGMRAPDGPCGWQPDRCSELALQP